MLPIANVIPLVSDETLAPEFRTIEVEGKPETLINVDGFIKLLKYADTPEARRLYRSYRKHRTMMQRTKAVLAVPNQKTEALMTAMRDIDISIDPVN